MRWPNHGSNARYLYQEIGINPPEQFIDFSANINPLGTPEKVKTCWADFYDKIQDYPDPYATKLTELLGNMAGVPLEYILIGNGGAEIITLLGRMLRRKNVLIVEPAFSEYEKVCQANECTVFHHQLTAPKWELDVARITEKLAGIDAIFLSNPNNPTGVYYPYESIVKLMEECKKRNILLIIDEAFYDFVEDYVDLTPLLKQYPQVCLVRSLTKMYAIPGLRLGYLVASPDIIGKLKMDQPHWSVNVLALLAGQVSLQDELFVPKTVQYIKNERDKLFSFFNQAGYDVSSSQVNFYLLRDATKDEQYSLFEFLLKKGIVPRHTYNFSGLDGKWLRFAIKSSEENDRLIEELTAWKQLP